MQTVAGNISPLYLQVDLPAVGNGLCYGIHGCAILAERFHHTQTPGILYNGPGHVPIRLRLHRCMDPL